LRRVSTLEANCLQSGLRIFKVPVKKYRAHTEFDKIKPLCKRAVFILHRCGFTNLEIAKFFHLHRNTISRWVKEAYEQYPDLKR